MPDYYIGLISGTSVDGIDAALVCIDEDSVNLGMVSFNKYINGTDPDDFGESYGFMLGLTKEGDPYEYPSNSGNVLKYVKSGDPVKGVGDLDDTPSDRR